MNKPNRSKDHVVMSRSELPDSPWLQKFRRRLKKWYQQHARDLSWRRSRSLYHIWVSEIMLQQTQVATVERYFTRFIKALPTIKALAAADEQQVLLLWEGLGYYRRARQLHKAAKVIVAEHQGYFPEKFEQVLQLPGIGRYTAGAILSIAKDQPHPILEANTIRLHSRLLRYDGDVSQKKGQNLLWSMAEAILPRTDVSQLNQAVMELGSEICVPKNPKCEECPVNKLCPTNAAGLQHEIPQAKKKAPVILTQEAALVIYKRDTILIRRCADGERWAGLWDFPRFSIYKKQKNELHRELVTGVKEQAGVEVEVEEKFAQMKHHVTKYRISLSCFQAKFKNGRIRPKQSGSLKWIKVDDLQQYPLSITGRKIAKLIDRD